MLENFEIFEISEISKNRYEMTQIIPLWIADVLKQVWGQIEHQSMLTSIYLIYHLNNKWSKRHNLGFNLNRFELDFEKFENFYCRL